jgi:hypothetical protein
VASVYRETPEAQFKKFTIADEFEERNFSDDVHVQQRLSYKISIELTEYFSSTQLRI